MDFCQEFKQAIEVTADILENAGEDVFVFHRIKVIKVELVVFSILFSDAYELLKYQINFFLLVFLILSVVGSV